MRYREEERSNVASIMVESFYGDAEVCQFEGCPTGDEKVF